MPGNPSDSMMAAQRAIIDNAQNLGLKSFEAATRLFELQTQAAQGLMGSGASATTPGDPMAVARGATEYTQRVAQVLMETQTEMMRLMQTQATELQSLFTEMMSGAVQQAAQMGSQAADVSTASTGGGGRRGKSGG